MSDGNHCGQLYSPRKLEKTFWVCNWGKVYCLVLLDDISHLKCFLSLHLPFINSVFDVPTQASPQMFCGIPGACAISAHKIIH